MAARREVRRSTAVAVRGGKTVNRRHTWSSEEFDNDLSFEDEKIRALADEREAVQKKTFTNWVNVHLSRHGNGAIDPVKNLYTDFQDGRLLCKLIQNLSGDAVGKLSRGKLRIHNLENVEKCLHYLRRNKVQLENVHAHDIVDGNPKIVLGLVWKLILKYHLTDVRKHVEEGAGLVGGVKASLLLWCQRMMQSYEGVKVTNFTSSWKDGRAFAVLLHRHRPDLLDFRGLLQGSPLALLEAVFAAAEKTLGVPRLIEPSDIVSVPEEKSVMTYVGALFQTFSRMKLSNTVTVRLTKILKTLQDRDRLVREFEEGAKRLLQWTSSRMNWLTNDGDVPTMEVESCKMELKMVAGPWQMEKREKLLEWNQMILTCHTLCCTLQGLPARMGVTLQSIQEAWLKLEAGEIMRSSLLVKRLSDEELAIGQYHKIGKRMERLLQKMHTLSQFAEQVDSLATLELAQEQLNRVITGLRQSTVLVDLAQKRCPHFDFSLYRERLLQLNDECGRIQEFLSYKAGFYSDQTVSRLLIQASALTEFLNEVKVSAASQNAALKLHSAHSSFQKERCRQLAIEVGAYLPYVKRLVTAMKKVCPPASAHSPLREVLSEKAEGLLRSYNALKRLGAEMAAAGKRREQKEFQELKEIEEVEREGVQKRREERSAARVDCGRATEVDVTSESEDEATDMTESGVLTNGIHDLHPAKDIHEDSPTSYLPEVMDHFVNSKESSVVTPPAPNERVFPLGEPFNDAESPLPSSTSESNLDQCRFEISAGSSGNISECTKDVTGLSENGRLPESAEVGSTQKTESEPPSLAVDGGTHEMDPKDDLPLMAAPPDEKLVSILVQVEAEWVSNCKSLLKGLKKETRDLELCSDADDIGEKAFVLLQRFQFLVTEAVVHLARTASLQQQIHSSSSWQSSHVLQEVELVKEAIVEVSQVTNKEVSILLGLLDRQEDILKCEYALSWFSEKDYVISDLDPPAGSADVSYQIHFVRNILVEAELVYNSIGGIEEVGPEKNMADNLPERKTLLPADKLREVQQGFDVLRDRAQGRVTLLEETLKAASFSEWADIFSIWLADKKSVLSRYTMPNSVTMAQCFVVYFRRCYDNTLRMCQEAVNGWAEHVAAMVTDCPTFSRGVQHIFATLKEDCDSYGERLRELEESQGLQLQIRFHLFKMDDLVTQLMNLIKADTPLSQFLSPTEISRMEAATNREMKLFETMVFSAHEKGKELIELTPPSEIGRKILTTEQDTLMSTWSQYQKGKLSLKQKLADMRVVLDLCSEADRQLGRVELMSIALQTPPDIGSKEAVKRSLVLHEELGADLVSLSRDINVFLQGAFAVVVALARCEFIVREVFGRVSTLKEVWSPLPPLWERRQEELADAYEMAVAMAPIEDSEDWLSRMDDILLYSSSASTEGEEKEEEEDGEREEEVMRALNEVEERMLQRDELFQLLERKEQTTPSEEDEWFLSKALLRDITFLDFSLVLNLQEPRALTVPSNSPPEEDCAEPVLETDSAQKKGILKPNRFYTNKEEEQDTMATLMTNGIHSRRIGPGNRQDSHLEVAEEDCLVIVQTDRAYTFDWGIVFGRSLFRDSPRASPHPFRRSCSASPNRTSPPVIERSSVQVLRDSDENDFFTRVEALVNQLEHPEEEAKRQVCFREQVLVFEYTPEASSEEEESDEISVDSYDDFHMVNSNVESGGLNSHAVVEDLFTASREYELRRIAEEERKKKRRDKVGSMWAWVNQRKTVGDKSNSVELVKATPLLDSPVDWDAGGEFPSDSSDAGAEEKVNHLYNVSSLISIIDRYEGKLMRKHEMESRSKKALKRSWKQFHTVAYLGQLSFYKDAKQALMGQSVAAAFYLGGAKCEVATDYQKRPHVFRLTLANGAAYIFQANNETEIREWVQNVQSQIQQETSAVGTGTVSTYSRARPSQPTTAIKRGGSHRTVASELV